MTTMHRQPRAGQSMVEFALVAPIFFLMLLGVMEMGRLLWFNHELTNGTREAARYAMVHGSRASTCATDADLITQILDHSTGLNADDLEISSRAPFCGDPGSTFFIETAYDFDSMLSIIPALDSLTLTARSEVIVQH